MCHGRTGSILKHTFNGIIQRMFKYVLKIRFDRILKMTRMQSRDASARTRGQHADNLGEEGPSPT
jgi:hypothetical protein